ncbi:TSUP family transporter [Georgenia sp. Z1344]|uniref:TSUP family transporter n=1 Tax=Georgenia sp. Z1344 TaxID=3416706 RepID=UPI003CEAD53D
MPEIDLTVLLLLVLAGLAAGWVDAVVGGGGLIQLPALLLVPGMSPLAAVATNKVGSIMGTTVSSITYYRRVHVDLRTALPMAGAALLAAIGGAVIASSIPEQAFTPIILAACVAVLVYTVARPNVGRDNALRLTGARHLAAACAIGAVIGLYDGVIGPGTGSFLVISLVGLLGYAFLQASGIAKIVNLATNLGALLFFVPAGHVVWAAGLAVGVGNLAGGYLGARMAVARGSGFVRVVFVVVVSVLVLRLGWQMGDELGWW